ncbi:DUF4058 family protein [Synechococcales cyanobacterium C]|uniref:DUF4058 family protein n=1 Tax=Petrachloros mirabilis ULC683 TaxID=2781853 RepID=A0A8K1ZYN5_9CYAN|nr:DUF4058 family protein [Petrachloros mirabilis]NCJ07589.1 DUF4058 family protein [Petrachloros mirabilis ULC683]
MSLQDHFRPPLSTQRHWHSFHNAWSTYLAENLNQILPEGYFAEPNVQFGIEIDVATWSEDPLPTAAPAIAGSPQWMPRSPTATLPFQPTTDNIEVQIFNAQAGPTLVGAIELVSPANKDRPSHRTAFVSKCQTYLQQGIGLVIVDVVTTLSANLHNELMQQLDLPVESFPSDLYAIAYRVADTDGTSHLSVWQEPLTISQPLPILPLFLKSGIFLPLDLEQTYRYTCSRQRISISAQKH